MEIYKNKQISIPYKESFNKKEIMLQAELYRLCKNNIPNINCILEYKHENCRFDAVIVHDNKIVCIVEIKDRKTSKKRPITKQIKRYSSFGIPVAYLINYRDIITFYNKLKNRYNK